MIRRMMHAAVALAAMAVLPVSCRQDDLPDSLPTAREGYVALRFDADVPAMQEVATRSVDPDGDGVQNMTLFCFDAYGLFVSTVTAKELGSTGPETGTFSADVPENTRTIHFVANQNMSEFAEDDFRNKSESEVMAVLEGSSGMMIYWARFACDPADESGIDAQMAKKGNAVRMIRNHARISVDNWSNEWLEVTGFVACNTNAFGTVAPFHPTKGFDFEWPGEDDPFVTLPLNDAKMSDIMDVRTARDQYVFECENRAEDPVSVIVRGHTPGQTGADDLYYRVMLLDEEGDQILIRRNHHYKLHIDGALSFGQASFQEALTAAATNNVWISISDEVNEVEDQDYVLTVEKTDHVLNDTRTQVDGGRYLLSYTVKAKRGGSLDETADRPQVTWLDGNRVARPGIGNDFHIDEDGVGQGTITIGLLPLGDNEKLEGTLLVKKGRLQRKIKVITIKTQRFTPAWVGTQVYGRIDEEHPTENRAHVTVMFTVPETCPAEVLPLRVLITTNELDIRSESGISLPVIRDGEEGYGAPNEYGYKYVYEVDKVGVQRVYFENVLTQNADYMGSVVLEADYFESLTKTFTYSENQRSITVDGLSKYAYGQTGSEDFPADEDILYRLVPQKRSANVQFDMVMKDLADDRQINVGEKDEFLLYSQHLDYYEDGDEPQAGVTEFDCTFYPVDEQVWQTATGGRMMMFMPRKPTNPDKGTGRYSIYMKTNCAKSAEVIRIASNQPGSVPVLPENGEGGYYAGNSYRSVTFELANYNPFRFAARVTCGGEEAGDDATGDAAEPVTPLEWTYAPEQEVDIAFDVTSFHGLDDKSADPFGEEFEIYIDAPMLKIDERRLSECKLDGEKLKADPSVPGRFIYTVAADRDEERRYGVGAALKRDDLASGGQVGERKRLPFVTGSIVSAGDIVLSSNEEKVVFFTKTFRVTNLSIGGRLQYRDAAGAVHDVPRNAFVSFERIRNGSRIGSVTVTADGRYELRLRKEYEFNWYADEVELHYEDDGGAVYHRSFRNLATLFDERDIELEPVVNE